MTADGTVSITRFGFRGVSYDLHLTKELMKIVRNGALFYKGKAEKMQIY